MFSPSQAVLHGLLPLAQQATCVTLCRLSEPKCICTSGELPQGLAGEICNMNDARRRSEEQPDASILALPLLCMGLVISCSPPVINHNPCIEWEQVGSCFIVLVGADSLVSRESSGGWK